MMESVDEKERMRPISPFSSPSSTSPFNHRFSVLLEQFPSTLDLDKILFQDESLLWASRLPVRFQFRSLSVTLCIISIVLFTITDIIILATSLSPIAMVLFWIPIPLIVLPIRYLFHRLSGTHVQVVTNYRVIQCTIKRNTAITRSLTFHCISGIIVDGDTVEFTIKPINKDDESNPKDKRKEKEKDNVEKESNRDVKSMVFRNVQDVKELEHTVQRQLHKYLSEFQNPPNIETNTNEQSLADRYYNLLDTAQNPIIWVSTPTFFEAHETIIFNIIYVEAWFFGMFISPAFLDPSILDTFVLFFMAMFTVVPLLMIFFNYLARVDVLTTKHISFFYTGIIKLFKWGPKVYTLDYEDVFPHTCEIDINDGSGKIDFESILMPIWRW